MPVSTICKCSRPRENPSNSGSSRRATAGASPLSRTCDPWAFLVYRRHAKVVPPLEPYNLGYSDLEAEHSLLLDREENHAHIAPIAVARAFLRTQHPPPPVLTPSERAAAEREL